jgi:UPF0755 protein
VSLIAAAVAGWTWHVLHRPLLAGPEPVEVRVAPGMSARAMARRFAAAGVDVGQTWFVVAATASGVTRRLRAGRYEVEPDMSLVDLIGRLRRGEVLHERFTLIEGWTLRDLRQALADDVDLRHDSAPLDEADLLRRIGAGETSGEGLFAPDTYLFDPGSSDLEILREAYRAQAERLRDAWSRRAANLPYTEPYQALIMASLVEKETGQPDDRRRIAGVLANRQRLGMLLQSDPTVIYGLGEHYDGSLHRRDLVADTPYNTYTRAGLPPTPIAAPGRAAIEATLNPEPTRAIYFVARGDGSTEFSETLDQHNRAVDRYQRGNAQ